LVRPTEDGRTPYRAWCADGRDTLAQVAALDYFETVQALRGWAGESVLISPARPSDGVPTEDESGLTGFIVSGVLKPLGSQAAEGRRQLSDLFEGTRPELALGDAPLELYERQVEFFTFEGMDDPLTSPTPTALRPSRSGNTSSSRRSSWTPRRVTTGSGSDSSVERSSRSASAKQSTS
jgi:hypothetical protein